ncbi:Induced myeloid leukemia cell differentiation protein Mcl-1-like [Holothuria leucospilota]|uniref:Induced myeloid leukemia cell differentiation protein Mcl-1-like n=1 Tax=Holothuria leucospilota TaxID=206669 RepID=A0A9Q1BE28_HOLLE|nr:Induced myeloid leukemia cell differentiation protein Mcl-1-like [Holothuria leucospilota]
MAHSAPTETAYLLGIDFMNYKIGLTSATNPSQSKLAETLRRVGDTIDENYNDMLNEAVMQLNINSEIVTRKTIHTIFDAMFKDGVYNWGRIVVLYVFTARLAKFYHEKKSNKAFIKILSTYVGDYIARDCAFWIENQGGWTFPEVPDELYNAGWRVHYSMEDGKPYFVNEETKMRSDKLPTLLNDPSSNVTLFENAVIDLTENYPAFYSERKQREESLASTSALKKCEPSLFQKGGPGKPCQQLMDEAMTRFPLGGKRHVVVKRYRGVPYVNIREYFGGETKDKLFAGKRGINLKLEEWNKLYQQVHSIQAAVSKLA